MECKNRSTGLLLAALLCGTLAAQTVPAGWKSVKDDKGRCQVSIPPDWTTASPTAGAASAGKSNEDSLVVTSDPFTLKPMPESLQKTMKIGKMFENTDKRVFYSTQTGGKTGYSVSVPGKTGSCNVAISFGAGTPDDTARRIVLSVGPAK